jgi:hypothetical protein
MQFLDADWERLTNLVAVAFRMDDSERTRLAGSRAARITGALPYLAGCRNPERTALTHLAAFVLACRGGTRKIFDHTPADDAEILARLEPIARFPGGDPAVIRKGMALLGLLMLGGYEKDREKDAASGEYNPLNSGAWRVEEVRARLLAEAASAKVPELDAIISTDEASVRGFWDD